MADTAHVDLDALLKEIQERERRIDNLFLRLVKQCPLLFGKDPARTRRLSQVNPSLHRQSRLLK